MHPDFSLMQPIELEGDASFLLLINVTDEEVTCGCISTFVRRLPLPLVASVDVVGLR